MQKSLHLYRARLGMRLLSVQDIPQHSFSLYFLGFTEDVPPCADLRSVGVREWLWQRPYTTLEIQYKWAHQTCKRCLTMLDCIPSLRPAAGPLVPMSGEGEGVDCIVMELPEDALCGSSLSVQYSTVHSTVQYSTVQDALCRSSLSLGPGGEHRDHDGVRVKIKLL